MKLFNYADGIDGHYCIGRRIGGSSYWEFYNLGMWVSAGQVFKSLKSAEYMLRQLTKKLV